MIREEEKLDEDKEGQKKWRVFENADAFLEILASSQNPNCQVRHCFLFSCLGSQM